MARPETVAILSPGEMGHAIGRTLARRGLRIITSLEGRSERTAGLTQAAGIEDVGNLDRVVDRLLLSNATPSRPKRCGRSARW